MGAAGDMRVQSRRSHAAEGDTMRKIAVLAATTAVIAALPASGPLPDKPKVAGHVQVTEASPVSPMRSWSNRAESSPSNTGPID
jgi:hypothetical protein